MFPKFVYNWCSKRIIMTDVHNFCSQNWFTIDIQNWSSWLIATDIYRLKFSQIMFTAKAHSLCSQLLFITCSQLLLTKIMTTVDNLCLWLLLTPYAHYFCLQLLFPTSTCRLQLLLITFVKNMVQNFCS